MRSITMLAVALLAIGLGGCQALGGAPKPLETREQALAHVSNEMLPEAISTYDQAEDEAARRKARDRIARARVYAVDVNYNAFSRSLSTQQKSFAVGSDVVAAGLTGAATLAKSGRTKTHLTTYASFALGLRGTVDKEFYFSKTLPAIVAQMDASRRVVLARIYEGLARSDTDYPLVAALADLESYYIAGTLNGAITQITNDAGSKSAKADEDIAIVNKAKGGYDLTSKTLEDYAYPADERDDAKLAELLKCMGPKADERAAIALIEGSDKEARRAAITCLKL